MTRTAIKLYMIDIKAKCIFESKNALKKYFKGIYGKWFVCFGNIKNYEFI